MRTLELAEGSPLKREMDRYLELYVPAYDDQHLLIAGGIADQPARYLEIIQLVKRVERETDAKFEAIQAENAK